VSDPSEKRAAAAFYLPRERATGGTAAVLAARVGFEEEHDPDWGPEAGRLFGRWGGLDGSYAWIEELPELVALAIAFRQRAFYAAMRAGSGDALEESQLPEPARAFVSACRTLAPDAAFLASRRHQHTPEYIRDVGRLVAGVDGYGLLDERLALLYLGPDASSLVSDGALRGRDHLRVEDGLVVFAATGPERWI
jgi:hypothetical protein